jgi:HipA-like protein
MRQATVYCNRRLAGILTEEEDNSYTFEYEQEYYTDPMAPEVSLTLPKKQRKFHSAYLFPFFYNMLAEGVNKKLQSRQLQIDEEDSFGLLLATAGSDTVGAITVKPLNK